MESPNARSPLSRWLLGLTLAVGLLVILFLAWLPFDPLEAPAPRLDRMLPVGVDLAVRFDGRDAIGSPLARSLWNHREVVALRERFDIENRVTAPLREVERIVQQVSLGMADPPSLEADLMPAEVVCALDGDEVLLITRISARARAVELVRMADPAKLREHGVTIEGEFLHVQRDVRELWIARRSDALVVSTSRALAFDSILCADRGGFNSLAGRSDFGDALHLGAPAGRKVYVWADPLALADRIRAAASMVAGRVGAAAGGEDPWWLEILAAHPRSFRLEADLSEAGRFAARLEVPFGTAALPPILAALDCKSSPEATVLERAAARYSVAGETIVAGGTTVHVAKAVEALLRSMPPEHQAVADQALAQAGESMTTVAQTLAHHFGDGVGFLVSRLGEAGAVQQENDEPGAVHAIPATIVMFRLRDTSKGGDAVIDELRRRAKVLFDAELVATEERVPGGARLFVVERHGLGGQWELLQPAFAIDGERFLFATHADHLRRALEAVRSASPRTLVPAQTFVARFRADPLRALVDDMRWEAADRETFRDWARERKTLEADLRAGGLTDDAALADALDLEIRARIDRRRHEDVPNAAEGYRGRWRWLEFVGDGDATAELRNGALEVTGHISVRE